MQSCSLPASCLQSAPGWPSTRSHSSDACTAVHPALAACRMLCLQTSRPSQQRALHPPSPLRCLHHCPFCTACLEDAPFDTPPKPAEASDAPAGKPPKAAMGSPCTACLQDAVTAGEWPQPAKGAAPALTPQTPASLFTLHLLRARRASLQVAPAGRGTRTRALTPQMPAPLFTLHCLPAGCCACRQAAQASQGTQSAPWLPTLRARCQAAPAAI